jgi:hypothetical protein
MAKISLTETGISGVPQWAGRLEERYLQSLRGPAGIEKMAAILRKEPAAYTAQRLVLLTAGQSTWTVTPASTKRADKKAAQFLDECWNDMSHAAWESVKFALSAQAFGFADLEIVWKRRNGRDVSASQPSSAFSDGKIGIRKLAVRRQETVERWEQDGSGGFQTMVQRDPASFREIKIPIEKLVHFIGGDDRASWEGLGWLEPAYKLYHMIENYEILEGVGWQRSFTGLPVFRWLQPPDPNGTDRKDVQDLGEGLVANEKQYVELPGPLVEFELASVTNTNGGDLREKINQLRWEIMSLVAVTFMRLGSTVSGSRALSDPLIESFTRGIDAALDGIAETLNRHLVPRLFAANAGAFAGMTDYPKLMHSNVTRLPLEVLQYLTGIQQFLDAAMPEDAIWLRELVGMPEIELEELEQAEDDEGEDEEDDEPGETEPAEDEDEGEEPESENSSGLSAIERGDLRAVAAEYRQAAAMLEQAAL